MLTEKDRKKDMMIDTVEMIQIDTEKILLNKISKMKPFKKILNIKNQNKSKKNNKNSFTHKSQ